MQKTTINLAFNPTLFLLVTSMLITLYLQVIRFKELHRREENRRHH